MEDTFLYERLADSITELIRVGTLRPGDRLPSVRALSRQQGVSVSTTLQAYRVLEDRRLVEARPQSGFYVRGQIFSPPVEPAVAEAPPAPQPVRVTDLALEVFEGAANPGGVPLGAAIPSPELMPTARLGAALARVARQAAPESNSYLLTQGYAPLRREVARLALDAGCRLAADDVVITCGCLEAISLCLQAVAGPGDTVAVEAPAYFGVLQLIESLDMQALELPTHPRDGLDPSALEAALAQAPVKACVLTPNFHNPLGSRMPEANKEAIVELLARREIPLIEDDLYGDLYFEPPRPRALKAYDRHGLVLSCGSFSKTLAPGYRVGWAVPGRFREQVVRLKLARSIATAAPLQLALAAFLEAGGYQRHLRRLRRAFQDNIERMRCALCEHFPEGTRTTRPQGGFVLWVELPGGASSLDLYRRARTHGIGIAPGPLFSANGQFGSYFRLNAGYPWSDEIDDALQTLGRLAGELCGRKN